MCIHVCLNNPRFELEIHYCEANEWKKLLKRSCSDNIGLQFHSFVYLHISTWMGEEISSYHQP